MILATLVNGVALMIAVGALATEAIGCFWTLAEAPGPTVHWVALLGIAINTGMVLVFLHGRGRDMNVEGAFLHMAADAAVSGGIVLYAVVMMATGWRSVDPLTGLLLCVAIQIEADLPALPARCRYDPDLDAPFVAAIALALKPSVRCNGCG